MGNKVGPVIASMLSKCGLDPKEKRFADLLALNGEVDHDVEEAFDSLMTLDAAKNNTTVKNYYLAQAYDPITRKHIAAAEKFGFTEEQINELKAEKSTGKRQDMITELLHERLEQARKESKKSGGENEKTLQAEIEKLQGELRKRGEEVEQIKGLADSKLSEYKLNSKYESTLNSQKWSKNFAEDDRFDLGRIAINKELEKLGVKMSLDEKGDIKLVKEDGSEYFDNKNKKVNFTEFVPQVLAQKKYLEVSSSEPATPSHVTVPPSDTKPKLSNSYSSSMAQSLADQGF